MQRKILDSTAVVSAGYDAEARELELEFRGGRVYRYRDVPRDVYEFLLRTPEKGRYVNRIIAERFSYAEVPPERREQDVLAALEASLSAPPSPRQKRIARDALDE